MHLTFEETSHTYAVDGAPVDLSVTGVLKRIGLIDFSNVPIWQLEAARARGIVVHQALHYFNEGDLDLARFAADYPDFEGYLIAWRTFCAERQFKAMLCEHRVYSPTHRIAGTIDALGTLDGRGVLLDFATGNPAEVAKDLQTAAYQLLAFSWQEYDQPLHEFIRAHTPIRRFGVALRRDGTFRLELYDNPIDTRHFLALLDAVRIVDARKRPAQPEPEIEAVL